MCVVVYVIIMFVVLYVIIMFVVVCAYMLPGRLHLAVLRRPSIIALGGLLLEREGCTLGSSVLFMSNNIQ